MNWREIPPHEWRIFLEGFGLRHRAWLVTVQQGPHGARQSTPAVDRPLAGVTAEPANGNVTDVVIRFGDETEPVRIKAPNALRVDETPRGEEIALEMEDARGVTRLRFRAGALPEEVDGLAPSEKAAMLPPEGNKAPLRQGRPVPCRRAGRRGRRG